MRSAFIVQTSTSVDIQETVQIRGKVLENYEGVVYRENFKINPFEEVNDKLFALRQKYEKEKNEVLQLLVKLTLNALYGEFLRKHITKSYQCKSEMWMQTKYDERVSDYQKVIMEIILLKRKTMKAFKMKLKKSTLYHYN